MNTLLIKPNTKQQLYGQVDHLSAIEPPLWLALLAKEYEEYSKVKIIDAEAEKYSLGDLLLKIMKSDPDIVIILATGSHPSAYIQQKEEAFYIRDILMRNDINTQVYDYLPFNPLKYDYPRWDLLPMGKYRAHNWHTWGKDNKSYGVVYTSISCPFHCEFCCIHDFYRMPYQQRPIDKVIDDFYELFEVHDITNFKIMDELFTVDKKRVNSICEQLEDIGKKINIWTYARIDTVSEDMLKMMKKAGINWIAYGIESGNEEIRKQVLKGKFDNNKIKDIVRMTKDCGIHIVGNYMFGFMEDNIDTMKETYDFACELNTEYANFYCTVAYPGSKLYDEIKKKNIVLPTSSASYAQMSQKFEPLSTKYISNKEVLKFRDESFYKYFQRAEYIDIMFKMGGIKVLEEIGEMTSIKLKRNLLK